MTELASAPPSQVGAPSQAGAPTEPARPTLAPRPTEASRPTEAARPTQTAPPTQAPSLSRGEQLTAVLRDLRRNSPELEAAAVVTYDGLPMAAQLPSSLDEDRVAAMSAALLSLGERAAAGLGRGELAQVYIEGDSGTVFLISAEDEAVLVAVAAKGAKAGMVLYEVRRAAAAVAEVLRDDAPPVPPVPVMHSTAPAQSTPPTWS